MVLDRLPSGNTDWTKVQNDKIHLTPHVPGAREEGCLMDGKHSRKSDRLYGETFQIRPTFVAGGSAGAGDNQI